MTRSVQTLLPYFGGNRTNAATVGELLKGCRWVGIPFAGGMPELLHIDAPSIVVSDLHLHVVNLARTLKHAGERVDGLGGWLADQLDSTPFHPLELRAAQEWCRKQTESDHHRRHRFETMVLNGGYCGKTAFAYFVTQWMGRSGQAGTDKEFSGNLSVRWNANGGDSNKRYRSAIEGIAAFQSVVQRCNFVCQDCFEFLANVQDVDGHGVYCDPPWPDAGAAYTHSVDDRTFHAKLCNELTAFRNARVVIRYGDHPLIRELYDDSRHWTIHEVAGRTQGGNTQAELLIVNRGGAEANG